MNKDLKRLILDVRKSKTAAQERDVIEREKAAIRKDIANAKTSNKIKCNNVSKIILIDMLGHDSSFAYFECTKLAHSSNFTEKRIGYLGIHCLLLRCPDLLMLCTSTIANDLNSDNSQIVSIALITVATFTDPNILISLECYILENFNHRENFIKFRAIGAAMALIRACPETIPDVLEKINETYMETCSVVFRSVIVLLTEILNINSQFKEKIALYVPLACGFLYRINQHKGSENTVIDPISQVYLLKFLTHFPEDITGESERLLLEISKNIGIPTKSAIKYQIAEVFIKSSHPNLIRIGNNILQSFLNNPSSNLKFCGLRICNKIAALDPSKVKINLDLLSCLSDPNPIVTNLALDLSSKLINSENVQEVLKSYLNSLMSIDTSLHSILITKISDALSTIEVDPVWHLDTVIRVTILANKVPEQLVFNCINMIRQRQEIHEYAAKKLFYAVNSGFRQESLCVLAFWTIGEYFETIDVRELEKLLEGLSNEKISENVMMYFVNMVFKLGTGIRALKETAVICLEKIMNIDNSEIQQRACEYSVILKELSHVFTGHKIGDFASAFEIRKISQITEIDLIN